MLLLASTVVDASVVAGIISAITGAIYTATKFSGDKRAGRIEEDRFYKDVYDDLNKTLWETVREQRAEIERLEARILKLERR